MPSYATKRGRRRVRAAVMVNGVSKKKWWPDDSKASFRQAAEWEERKRREMVQEGAAEAVSESEPQTPTASCPSIHEWGTAYLAYVKPRMAAKTWEEKRMSIKRLLSFFRDPHGPVSDIDVQAAMGYITDQASQRSGYGANKDRKNLAAGWEWGHKYMDRWPDAQNPFRAVDRMPEEREPRYVPPEADFWAVYEQAQGQDQIMLLTAFHLALRRNELFGLRWSDLNLSNNAARVWTSKRRGGNREFDWIPVTEELKGRLLWWWENRPFKTAEHVFVQTFRGQGNLAGSRWHKPGEPFISRQHWMRELCERAGVPRFGLHAIRHLSATKMFHAGYSISAIQKMLRHKSPSTTERYLQRLGLDMIQIDNDVFSPSKGKVLRLRKAQ